MNNEIRIGKYKHYKKGNLYQVLGFALHSETHEEMVIYQALYECEKFGSNRVWVRPKNMFLENVECDGAVVSRFQFIESGHRNICDN